MNRQIVKLMFASVTALLMTACGGGGSSSEESASLSKETITQTEGIVSLNMPPYQVQGNTNPDEVIIIPSSASITINAINPVEIDSSLLVSKSTSEAVVTSHASMVEGSPLFVDGVYSGVIDSYTNHDDGTATLVLVEAEALPEVIDSISISVDTTKSLPQQSKVVVGASPYDKDNAKKMTYSIAASKTSEPVLRIDIPKGYKIPTKAEKVDCDVLEAECDVDYESEYSKGLDLGVTETEGGLTISTEGSHLEIGLGTLFDMHVDLNLIEEHTLRFSLRQSAHLKSNIKAEFTGKLANDIAKEVPLTREITAMIPIGYGAFLKFGISPFLTIGANGEIEGKLKLTNYSEREGDFLFSYDSQSGESPEADESIVFNPTHTGKDGVELEVKASSEAFMNGGLEVTPSVSIIGLLDLDIVNIRGGLHTTARAEGEISGDFEVENTEDSTTTDATASFTITTKPKMEYMMDIAIDPAPEKWKEISFYKQSKYSLLFEGSDIEVFDWEVFLLQTPTVDEVTTDGRVEVSFGATAPGEVRHHLKFYYTKDGSDPLESEALKWNQEPILITEPTTIKVKTVLSVSDYSESFWAFGKSVSLIKTAFIDPQDTNDTETVIPPIDPFNPPEYNDENITIPQRTCPLTEEVFLIDRYAYRDQDGNGVDCSYYQTGELYTQSPLVGWKVNGVAVSYWQEGGVKMLVPYIDSVMNGTVYNYDENGGISSHTEYVNGKRHGLDVSYGSEFTGVHWVSTGIIIFIDTYVEGIQNGPSVSYYESGALRYQSEYKDGVQNGPVISYYESGGVHATATILNGYTEGVRTTYWENGTVAQISDFTNGVLNGRYISYTSDGRLVVSCIYSQGTQVSCEDLSEL